jgi:hypothetical protein
VQIDSYSFAYCENLSEVTLGNGMEKIMHAAFAYDDKITQVTLPSTLKTVGQYAFCGTGLSCITIPNSLEEISYCAFGYDGDMKAIHDFVIYGEPYSMAQQYAVAEDEENDYKNNFNFIAVEDASIPYELGGGKLYVAEDSTPEENSSDDGTVIAETDENGNPVNMDDRIGAGLFGNKRLQLFLGIGGGIAILLAVLLLISYLKRPRDTEAEKAEKTDEPDKAEDTDASDDADDSDNSDDSDHSDDSDADEPAENDENAEYPDASEESEEQTEEPQEASSDDEDSEA